jgi:hypothetical protein
MISAVYVMLVWCIERFVTLRASGMPECCARQGGLAAKEQFVLSQLLSQKIITANNCTRATVCAEMLIYCKA